MTAAHRSATARQRAKRLRAVVRIGAALGVVTAVGAGPAVAANATVRGQNGRIVFRADTGSGDNLYTIHQDGTHRRQITFFSGASMDGPHWSPNADLIVVGVGLPDTCSNVVLMSPSGHHEVTLPLANGDICEGTPSLSPDGARIYYEAFDGTNDAIWSMNLDGSDRRQASACQGTGATAPEVSPDGQMLAMTCFSDAGQALFVAGVDGANLRQLTPFDWDVGLKNDWSPDSSRIMFITQIDDAVNTDTIQPDGNGLVHVTNYDANGPGAFGNTYSPDGRWILMRLQSNGLYSLVKVHPDGSAQTQVTPYSTFRPRGMAWGSDG